MVLFFLKKANKVIKDSIPPQKNNIEIFNGNNFNEPTKPKKNNDNSMSFLTENNFHSSVQSQKTLIEKNLQKAILLQKNGNNFVKIFKI